MESTDYRKKVKKIADLTIYLNECRKAYYVDSNPIISDYEYDQKFDELERLENEVGMRMANSPTQTVGYEVIDALEKVTHSHPMLSLDKTKSTSDLVKFSSGRDCVISLKMDGLTCLCSYENGELSKAETRGDGTVGENIIHTAKVFDNLPVKIPMDRSFEIEGEAVIRTDDFEKINLPLIQKAQRDALVKGLNEEESKKYIKDNTYANPRNLASGSVRQLDSGITKDRHVRFVVWKIPFGFSTFSEGFRYAKELGFEVVPYLKYNSNIDDIDERIAVLKEIADEMHYPIDGLVITYDNVEYGKSLGMTGHHPRHSLAYKFYDEESVTTLTDVEWSMGKTGVLSPVAIFEPVEIDGTTVSRASVHNVSIFKDFKLGFGDEITVYKANQIIPQLRENLTQSGTCAIPKICPICGEKTIIKKDNDTEVLMCSNDYCKGKLLGKISHAVSKKALNIDGLSDATIEKFIELGWLKSIREIYGLYLHKAEMKTLDGFGERSVEKLLASIEKSREITFNRFLCSLSIPLLGSTQSKVISKAVDEDCEEFFSVIEKFGAGYFRNLPGIGDSIIDSMNRFFEKYYTITMIFSKEFCFQKKEITNDTNSVNLSGKIYVITGSLQHFENRDKLKELIESYGGKVSGSISSKTSFLINNDVESTSGKNKKAKELNIPIISEDDFLKSIGK